MCREEQRGDAAEPAPSALTWALLASCSSAGSSIEVPPRELSRPIRRTDTRLGMGRAVSAGADAAVAGLADAADAVPGAFVPLLPSARSVQLLSGLPRVEGDAVLPSLVQHSAPLDEMALTAAATAPPVTSVATALLLLPLALQRALALAAPLAAPPPTAHPRSGGPEEQCRTTSVCRRSQRCSCHACASASAGTCT